MAALRTSDLEAAIAGLASSGIVRSDEASKLAGAYAFLRRLINALRMLRGIAEDLELPEVDSLEARHLARRMGYHEPEWRVAAEALENDFARQTALVREFVSAYISAEMLPGVQSSSFLGGRHS